MMNVINDLENKIICTDAMVLLKSLPDNCIDLILTDPPYKISVKQSAGAFGVKKRMHYKKELEELSEGISDDILNEFCRVLKKINIYLFCSKNQIPQFLDFFVKEKGCNWQLLTWHKNNVIPACGNSYMSDTEYCLFFREKGVKVYGSPKTKATYYVTPRNVKDKRLYNHPTPKPIHIFENLIINSSLENDLILDTYVGSGTTAKAAIKLNRRFIASDNNPKYVETANERIKTEQLSLSLKP